MKKLCKISLFLLLAALLSLGTLTSCVDPDIEDQQPSDPTDTAAFNAQYCRTGFREDLHNPSVTVIRTRWELDVYLDTFPYPEASWDNAPTLTQLCERYDEEYFATRDLIVVLLEEGSGSTRHKVTKVGRDDNTGEWTLGIEAIFPDGGGTADMAGWHVLIEPPKDMRVQEGDTFKIGEHSLSPLPLDTFGYYWGGVQYVRTDGGTPGTEFPRSVIIRSDQELHSYYEQNRELYNMNSPHDESPAFSDAIERYDNAYFKDRELLIVFMEEPSGSIRHNVNFLREIHTQGIWEVSITSFTSMYATEDMAQWHILIEMPEGLHTDSGEDITLLFTKR